MSFGNYQLEIYLQGLTGVLPTLPMFLLMPWFIKKLGGFWPALGAGILLSIGLYWLTMRLLKLAGVNL